MKQPSQKLRLDVLSTRVAFGELGEFSRYLCVRYLVTFSTGGQDSRHAGGGTWKRGPRPPGQSQNRLDRHRTSERCFRISTSPVQTWRTGPQPPHNLHAPLRSPSVKFPLKHILAVEEARSASLLTGGGLRSLRQVCPKKSVSLGKSEQ